MIRTAFIALILCFPYALLAKESYEFDKDERFEITLNALKNRIALNTYYKITKQYHRLNYVIDMQEKVLKEPFFEEVNLVEHKLKEIHDLGKFGIYVIISIPYAPQFNETPEQVTEYHRLFTLALYDKGYHEASAGKGIIVNIDGAIIPKPVEKKIVTAYTAYIGFGSSLSNETIQKGVDILKDFSYYIKGTRSKTQACIKLVDNVYKAFTDNLDLDFNSSEYTLVYSIDTQWDDIYRTDIDDPQPRDLTVINTKHGMIKDYTGILKRSEDQRLVEELTQRIDGENDLLDNPVFRVYMTSDFHLSNSRSAIQLVYDVKENIRNEEVILGFHFRSSDTGIEVQYEILIGEDYVYPEQKQKIAETFILPFLRSNEPFGKILQETLFISLEYASLMGKASTSFEKSNVPREWWDNDNYFFYLSPEVAGIIDGSLEIAGGAISMGELMVDIGGLGVDLVSDRDETIASIRNEAGEVMYIALEGVAAYAALSNSEQDTLIAQIQGEINQEISDYLTLVVSGTREGRYEASKLAFNIISTFVGVAELKILFKTGKWSSAALTKIRDAKNAFRGVNNKEALKGLLRQISNLKNIRRTTQMLDELTTLLQRIEPKVPVDLRNIFKSDFGQNIGILRLIDVEPSLIIAWQKLNIPSISSSVRQNIVYLKAVNKQILIYGDKIQIKFERVLSKVDPSDYDNLFASLENPKSIDHVRSIVGDFESIPGISSSTYVSNSLSRVEISAPASWKDPLLFLPADAATTFTGSATAKTLSQGQKIYRVLSPDQRPSGGFWTYELPSTKSDLFGGTAVRPEWNGATHYVEYTVPESGLKIWDGPTANQPVLVGIDEVSLPGGSIQIYVPDPYRKLGNEFDKLTLIPIELK